MPLTTICNKSFEIRPTQFVSELCEKEDADKLLKEISTHSAYLLQYHGFVAESTKVPGKFRVVLSAVALATQLLNRYYPVINKNKFNNVNSWGHSFNEFNIYLIVSPQAYIHHNVYRETEDIGEYIKMLKKEPFNLVIKTYDHRQCSQHNIVSTMTHPFFVGLLNLDSQCQEIVSMIDTQEQNTALLNRNDIELLQYKVNQNIILIQNLYPYANLSYITDRMNILIANFYYEKGNPGKALQTFLKLASIESEENQKKLEQLILAYYMPQLNTSEKQLTFLPKLIKALTCVTQPSEKLKSLIVRCCYPMLHAKPMAADENPDIKEFWNKYSSEKLTKDILYTHPELLLLLIKYSVKDEATPLPYMKAINLLTSIPNSTKESRELLMQCLTDFFVATKKIEKPYIQNSKIPYFRTFSDLINALNPIKPTNDNQNISSIRSMRFYPISISQQIPSEKHEAYVLDVYRRTAEELMSQNSQLNPTIQML